MAVTITIGGVQKSIKAGSLHIAQTANGRNSARFVVESTDGTYRPALDATVLIEEDGTAIFGGLVDVPRETGLVEGAKDAIGTEITAVDYQAYTERRFVNEAFPAQTLKARLTSIVGTYLDDYGVTLHGSQVDGPTLPAVEYQYRRVDEVLNELMTLTADAGDPFVYQFSPTKVLRAFQPTTAAAPFNITGSLPYAHVLGDITVETKRSKEYANKIILKVPTKTETNRVETFTGDGSTHSFPLQYTLTGMRYIVTVDGVDELLTFQGIGFDLAVQWLYYAADNTIRRETSGTPDAPDNGAAISITFDGNYSAEVTAEDAGEIAAHGIWERVVVVENVPSDTTAQALADAYLAKAIFATQTVKYKTLTAGVLPGQEQTITVPRRNINATAVISDVSIRDFGKDELLREVTVVVDGAQTNLGRNFRDVYSRWDGDKAGGSAVAASVGAGAPAVTGPAPPDRSVQWNNTGSFGGDEAFTYDPTTDTVMIGVNHTPGASYNLLNGEGHTVS